MRINNNLAALNTYGRMVNNSAANGKSLEKLSSGLRINKAGDDAAGLSISEKMRAQIKGLDQAARNGQDSISMIQTAEGALSETENILQRMRELAVQSSNATNTDADRGALQSEISQLKDEIDRIGNTTEFNTKKLLNGSLKSTNAAVSSGNTTTSADIFNQTQATVTASAALISGSYDTVDVSDDETIVIDKTELKIDWDGKLSSSEEALMKGVYSTTNMSATQEQQIKDAIQRVVNETIDEYNTQNGAAVDHVNVYKNSAGKLVLQSGKSGQDSEIRWGSSSSNASTVLSVYMNGAGAGSTVTSASGDDLVKASVTGGVIDFEIKGVRLMTAAITNGDLNADADTLATDVQSIVRTAASTYNQNSSLTSGMDGWINASDIFVDASKGRLTFTTAEADGAIKFMEREGKSTIKDMGLTQAQTELAGNGGLTFQIGSNKGQTMNLGINDMRSQALNIASVNISSQSGASNAISTLENAISKVSSERSKLGAVQNRLEHTINNLGTSSENLNAAESRIRDVDMAKEMMQFTKTNILNQAAQAMMAQANQQPQGVLQLLR